jgi:hypothetical protein
MPSQSLTSRRIAVVSAASLHLCQATLSACNRPYRTGTRSGYNRPYRTSPNTGDTYVRPVCRSVHAASTTAHTSPPTLAQPPQTQAAPWLGPSVP